MVIMKVNLALYILRLVIVSASTGEGGLINLGEFRRSNRIPSTTFHRHINSLIDHGFIVRISRDTYTLKAEFVEHVMSARYQLPLPSEFNAALWSEVPW